MHLEGVEAATCDLHSLDPSSRNKAVLASVFLSGEGVK
jgi:hypothetical protein